MYVSVFVCVYVTIVCVHVKIVEDRLNRRYYDKAVRVVTSLDLTMAIRLCVGSYDQG